MTHQWYIKFLYSRAATWIFWVSIIVSLFLLINIIIPETRFHISSSFYNTNWSMGFSISEWTLPYLAAFIFFFLAALTIGFSRAFIIYKTYFLPWWQYRRLTNHSSGQPPGNKSKLK
jgi:hypothetical protein